MVPPLRDRLSPRCIFIVTFFEQMIRATQLILGMVRIVPSASDSLSRIKIRSSHEYKDVVNHILTLCISCLGSYSGCEQHHPSTLVYVMQDETRQNSATSPIRRSSRVASRDVSTQMPPRRSTPKHLNNFDWDSFDPNQFDPGLWDVDDADFSTDVNNLDPFPIPGGDYDATQFDPQLSTSLNLLQNPLSAVPGALDLNLKFDQIPETFDYYPLNPAPNAAPHYSPVQPVAFGSPLTQRKVSRSTSKAFHESDYGGFDATYPVEPVSYNSPSAPHRSLHSATRDPTEDVVYGNFDDAAAEYDPQAYQYPEPFDPRIFANSPYALGNIDPANDSLFIPETRPSSHPSVRSRRSPIEAVDIDRRRQSFSRNSYHSGSTYPDVSHSSRSGSESAHKRKSVFQDTFKYERPQADSQKPWIRTNGTTRGLTTRTAKCNSYDPGQYYTYTPPPLGDWSSRRNEFQYTKNGELSDATYSAEQIRDFILNYPEDKDGKTRLQLFIQVGPTDSARRYLSQTWAKCRFRDCPVNKYEKGTILHGHYRVAFDERSYGTSNRYDPHLAASAYAHLYCMERFLDFEYICRKTHVQVDTRQYSTEPKGKFHATLSGRPECGIAQEFVKYASRGTLRTSMSEFAEYPVHSQYAEGQSKPHEHTLTAHMHKVKAGTRPAAQIKQFEDRGLGPSHILVNKGDLEVLMQEKRRKKDKAAKNLAKRKRERDLRQESDDEDEDDGNEDYSNKRRRLVAEAKNEYVVSNRRAPMRNVRKDKSPEASRPAPWEVDDDEDSANEQQPISPRPQNARRSPRNANQHINYREPSLELDIPSGYQPAVNHFRRTPTPTSGRPRRRGSVYIDPELAGVDFDALFKDSGLNDSLNRRSSSIVPFTPLRTSSILRSTGPRWAGLRSASLRSASSSRPNVSFAKQPVTRSHTFDTQAPPQDVDAREMPPPPSPRRTRLQLKTLKEKEELSLKDAGTSRDRPQRG